jgi:hypothetical protein
MGSLAVLAAVAVLVFPAVSYSQATASIKARLEAAKGGKLSIALVPIDSTSSNDWTKPVVNGTFETALFDAGRFKVVSRSELAAIKSDQVLSNSGMNDPEQAVALGRGQGANYVVVVRLMGYEQKKKTFPLPSAEVTITMQAQALDAESHEIVHSKDFSATYKLGSWKDTFQTNQRNAPQDPAVIEPYRTAVAGFAKTFSSELAAAVPFDAIVAAVSGQRIAITGGSEVGIREGAEFEVIEEGKPIKVGDQILGYDSKIVGRLRINRVEPKLAWAAATKTFDEADKEDPTPVVTRIKVGQLAHMVPVAEPEPAGKKK